MENTSLTAEVSAPSVAVRVQFPTATVRLMLLDENVPAVAAPLTVPFRVIPVHVPPVFASVTVDVSVVHREFVESYTPTATVPIFPPSEAFVG